MFYYNTERVLVPHDYNNFKWATEIECNLAPSSGNEIVFGADEWKYQSKAPKAWTEYLISINVVKILNTQEVNAQGKIVDKPLQVLIDQGLITQEEYKKRFNAPILNEISNIEKKQARSVREYIAYDLDLVKKGAAKNFIEQFENQIKTLRVQLK